MIVNQKRANLVLLVSLFFFSTALKAQQAKVDSLLTLLDARPDRDSIRVDVLNEIALIFVNGDKEPFFEKVKEARELSAEIGYIDGEAESYRLLSGFFLRRGAYDSGTYYLEKASTMFSASGNKKGIALSNRGYAMYHTLTDNYSQAIDFSFKAINQFEQLNDLENLSKTFNNLAGIFLILEEYDKALEYYEKASEIETELGNLLITVSILVNIAEINISKGEYENSTENLKESLNIARDMQHPLFVNYILTSLGRSLFLQGDHENAKSYYEESLAMAQKYGFSDLESDDLIGLSEVYLDQNELSRALYYGKKSLDLTEKLGSIARLNRVYKTLADLNYALGNYKQAFEFHQKYKTASDSLFSEKNFRRLTNLENQYEFEKEKEIIAAEQAKKDEIQEAELIQQTRLRNIFIAGSFMLLILAIVAWRNLSFKRRANQLLTKQKDEIEKQSKELEVFNEKLRESNATKDKFFSIVSHDLKGPLNSIIGLSELLLSTHSEFDDEKREEVIRMLVESSTNAFNFSENLLKWSISQTGGLSFQPSPLTTGSIISNTFSLVGNSARNKKIELSNTSTKDVDLYADKDQIETVLRNLISNAIKFTKEMGSITINASEDERNVFFSVSDTGVGMKKEKIEKLFTLNEKTNTKGTNNEMGTGLGLILCKEFIEMHKGKIWVESEVGKGSKFYFSIPKEIA